MRHVRRLLTAISPSITRALSVSVLAVCALVGCTSSSDSGDASASSSASDGGAEGGDAAGSVAPGASDIVFNELSATGSGEWIEIANGGANAFDLGGYAIADSEKTTITPKKDDAMIFPPGTTIASHARILILVGKEDLPVGPYPKSDCLANGPETCFFATFGISASNGEALHLLAPDGSVVTTTAYPRNLGIDPAANRTACRLPEFSGEFASCAATPGAANAP